MRGQRGERLAPSELPVSVESLILIAVLDALVHHPLVAFDGCFGTLVA